MKVGQVIIPFEITVNKISIRSGGTVDVAGTYDLTLYSEDGQTKLFSVTTASVDTINTIYTTAVSSVVVSAGIYYIAINPNSTTNAEISIWENGNVVPFTATTGLPTDITDEPKMQGTVTITAGTPPATITPASITEAVNQTLIFRLDN